ncbi:zinc finger, GRF-type containing protein [Tanacetum coccineum]
MSLCLCGQQTLIRTSWTNNHPGRRFHTCPRLGGTSCDFFDWYDPPICARARNIIPGLLRARNQQTLVINQLEASLATMAVGRQRLRMWLIITRVYIGNLSPNITNTDLEREFSVGGSIIGVMVDHSDKVFGAVAFVNFLDKEDAVNAD